MTDKTLGQALIDSLDLRSRRLYSLHEANKHTTGYALADKYLDRFRIWTVARDRIVLVDGMWVDEQPAPDDATFELDTFGAPENVTILITADDIDEETVDMLDGQEGEDSELTILASLQSNPEQELWSAETGPVSNRLLVRSALAVIDSAHFSLREEFVQSRVIPAAAPQHEDDWED